MRGDSLCAATNSHARGGAHLAATGAALKMRGGRRGMKSTFYLVGGFAGARHVFDMSRVKDVFEANVSTRHDICVFGFRMLSISFIFQEKYLWKT